MSVSYKWYMVSTVSGKEEKVIEALKNKISSQNKTESFEEIRIFKMPHLSAKELEKKTRGEEYTVKYLNIYKGYIFIKMEMTDESWYLVRNTQFVTGLIGSSGKGAKPTPISEKTFQKMVEKERALIEKFEAGDIETPFKEGVIVKIISGQYKGVEGEIVKNNDITCRAFVNIELFGRKTPTEFGYEELEICS
ncbi:transcription termination/antitermination protein NusG [Mycoplasma enhydrae]|uniref:transcription termination/antitermination protein NusG n=1 Tax=Mycoplasma enhydrae TaxID=2499220 RepID=UPI00197BE47B|nr:transcription termination/antitermination protein NusG [Mycoplasma enhydrae]MBN4089217.1 transcription termination/antitermination protein NusG [Mycoplasma enhydrae]MCV3733872.1 transcription termination/antitermination protein NusG [Mycoplasma enhydrae]MCV3753661.1 transcription termination/antitermination protein NusG [Mycoplasma enhydrae]